MSEIRLVTPDELDPGELLRLYGAVGWGAYTAEPDVLLSSMAGSHRIAAAREAGDLVGLARTISDGTTIVYLQDVLVMPNHQRRGLGRRLVATLLGSYGDIRQQVLLTDTEPGQRSFYEALGFTETHDMAPAVRAFVRLGAMTRAVQAPSTRPR